MIQAMSHERSEARPSGFAMLMLAIGIAAFSAEAVTQAATPAEAEADYDRRHAACEAQYEAAEERIYAEYPESPGEGLDHELDAALQRVFDERNACKAQLEANPSWNIPERLKIRYGEPKPPRRYRPAPCAPCLDEWEAIDVAQAFLEKFGSFRFNKKGNKAHTAEIVEDFPWRGSERVSWRHVGSVWHFGYGFGVRYSGEKKWVKERYPEADHTWRVWFQTGWTMPEEIAYAVDRGWLPKEALEWGRQRRDEFLLVHARTGRVELPRQGRDRWMGRSSGWKRKFNYGRPSDDGRSARNWGEYKTAKKAAFQRAKKWLPPSSDPLLNYRLVPQSDDENPPDDERYAQRNVKIHEGNCKWTASCSTASRRIRCASSSIGRP